MGEKLIFFGIFLISITSYSQKWIESTQDKFGNKYYIQSDLVSRTSEFGKDDATLKIWTKHTVKKITVKRSKTKNQVYLNAYIIELMEYDCGNSKSRVLSRTVYSAKGGVIANNDIDPNFSDWEYIIPDSVGETMIKDVCDIFN
jgi:hypothetical protein